MGIGITPYAAGGPPGPCAPAATRKSSEDRNYFPLPASGAKNFKRGLSIGRQSSPKERVGRRIGRHTPAYPLDGGHT